MKKIIVFIMVLMVISLSACSSNGVSKTTIEHDLAGMMDADEQIEYKIGKVQTSGDGYQYVDIKLTQDSGAGEENAVVRFEYTAYEGQWSLMNWDVIEDWH